VVELRTVGVFEEITRLTSDEVPPCLPVSVDNGSYANGRAAWPAVLGHGGNSMSRRVVFVSALVLLLRVSTATQQRDGGDVLARIRAEGLQRSRALALYRTLTDEIGHG
jgi:hypothetical protein